MSQQIALFGSQARVFADGERGRIAYYPAIFSAGESTALFETLQRDLCWEQESMWMYDRTVTVPRLIARLDPQGAMPPLLQQAVERIEAFLATRFNSVSAQYYRDGSDSVAWHNDHTEELIDRPTIALLSLGATREIQVRTKARPRTAYRCDLEPGSLFVMSGRSQDFYEHHIPKVRRPTTPRISIALRQRTSESRKA